MHYKQILSYVRKNSHEPEDIAQEVFTRAYVKNITSKAGLYAIAKNLCIDATRSKQRWQFIELLDTIPAEIPCVDKLLFFAQIGIVLVNAISKLPVEQRDVFLLRCLEDMPFQEIADKLGCPEPTAKTRFRSACKKLQEALNGLV